MRPTPHSAGFTLLEVMTTVAIVSLLLVMVYSSWSSVLDASENSQLAAQNTHRERMTLQALTRYFPVWPGMNTMPAAQFTEFHRCF